MAVHIWYSTYLGPQIPIETTSNTQIVWVLEVTIFASFYVSFWDPGKNDIKTRMIERTFRTINYRTQKLIIEQNW